MKKTTVALAILVSAVAFATQPTNSGGSSKALLAQIVVNAPLSAALSGG